MYHCLNPCPFFQTQSVWVGEAEVKPPLPLGTPPRVEGSDSWTPTSPSASVSISPAVFIVPDNVSQGSYLQAANVDSSTLEHPTASMPSTPITFLGSDDKPGFNEKRQAYLDTGCNCNLMSRRAVERDLKFLGPNAIVKNIKPFSVSVAVGQIKSYCLQVLHDPP